MSCALTTELFEWASNARETSVPGSLIRTRWSADIFHRQGTFHETRPVDLIFTPMVVGGLQILPARFGGRHTEMAGQGPPLNFGFPSWSASITITTTDLLAVEQSIPVIRVKLQNWSDARLPSGNPIRMDSFAGCGDEVLLASDAQLFVILTYKTREVREPPH